MLEREDGHGGDAGELPPQAPERLREAVAGDPEWAGGGEGRGGGGGGGGGGGHDDGDEGEERSEDDGAKNEDDDENNEEEDDGRNSDPDADDKGYVDPDVPACAWNRCGKQCTTLKALVEHLSAYHIGGKKPTYTCEWDGCSRQGLPQASRFALTSHLRGHTGEKPFDCPVPECDKSFSRSDALPKHLKCHQDVPRELLGKYADMVDGGLPPQKLSRKRKADQHDAGGENSQEGVASAHGRRVHHRLSSSARGGPGGADAHRADVSDSELDGLEMSEMVHRYHILKAKYASIRHETEALSKSYGHVRRRLRRLKTEKDVLLDSLIATTRSTIDTWRRTAAEAKAQREQDAPEDTPMRLSAE